jgi:hypothetical protein
MYNCSVYQVESILENVGFISIQVPDYNLVPEG